MTKQPTRAELVVLDVGHGSSAVLHGDRTMVIDAGPGSSLLHYLADQDINDVLTVILSHADSDHIKGLIALLGSATVHISEVVLNSDALKGSQLWQDLLYELDDYKRRSDIEVAIGLVEGDQLSRPDETVVLHVVAPRIRIAGQGAGASDRAGRSIDSNTMSAVIRVDFGTEPRVLLTGDLDLVGLDHLLDAGVEVSAPILVFPHHGGRTRRGAKADENATFTERLMHAVQPRVVIFSIGRGMNATPRPEIVEAVRTYGGEARVVCTQLSEHCASELPSQEPSHLEARFARGRTRRSCCAGSIVIPLDPTAGGPDACMPTAAEHALFISEWAPVALCRRSPA